MPPIPETTDSAPSMLTRSDQSLVRMVRDGDEHAASQLYDRYARRVLGLVDAKLGSKLRVSTEPEDIVQSVFRSMFRGVQTGNYDAPPGKTLWNLLAIIAVSKLRDQANRHSAQCRDASRNVRLSEDSQNLEINNDSLEFLKLCLRETLETLRPLDREVLTLRIQGHSIDEISQSISRSHRTVERMLQKSRQRLADMLLSDD
ncbi:RNA polymerase sigma factor [Rubripirellula lacrimiformis]|uniref:RNA polymerase sigma factor n=1 Tax=Rubripirellula lacrimiformis TaxID=1930273 RepID=A0A517NA92_9BACT|nr:sigma-70 family RNA polymerase sigma factor [Rubripirellula lacrimiformis]QDT04054.1 RNA polymerase sigma factor [Rubripirellula lacrimiformis]